MSAEAAAVRPHACFCILRLEAVEAMGATTSALTASDEGLGDRRLRQFIDAQTAIHDRVGQRRVACAIGTHDLESCKSCSRPNGDGAAGGNVRTHAQMADLFKEHGWIPLADISPQKNIGAVRKYLRTGERLDPRNVWHRNETKQYRDFAKWDDLLDSNPRAWHDVGGKGPVVNADGELIFDNPKFVDQSSSKAFSLQDTTLRVDDLLAANGDTAN